MLYVGYVGDLLQPNKKGGIVLSINGRCEINVEPLLCVRGHKDDEVFESRKQQTIFTL